MGDGALLGVQDDVEEAGEGQGWFMGGKWNRPQKASCRARWQAVRDSKPPPSSMFVEARTLNKYLHRLKITYIIWPALPKLTYVHWGLHVGQTTWGCPAPTPPPPLRNKKQKQSDNEHSSENGAFTESEDSPSKLSKPFIFQYCRLTETNKQTECTHMRSWVKLQDPGSNCKILGLTVLLQIYDLSLLCYIFILLLFISQFCQIYSV